MINKIKYERIFSEKSNLTELNEENKNNDIEEDRINELDVDLNLSLNSKSSNLKETKKKNPKKIKINEKKSLINEESIISNEENIKKDTLFSPISKTIKEHINYRQIQNCIKKIDNNNFNNKAKLSNCIIINKKSHKIINEEINFHFNNHLIEEGNYNTSLKEISKSIKSHTNLENTTNQLNEVKNFMINLSSPSSISFFESEAKIKIQSNTKSENSSHVNNIVNNNDVNNINNYQNIINSNSQLGISSLKNKLSLKIIIPAINKNIIDDLKTETVSIKENKDNFMIYSRKKENVNLIIVSVCNYFY